MKRVGPKALMHSRPVSSGVYVSIYANDAGELTKSVNEARLLALRDHDPTVVKKCFEGLDNWTEVFGHLRAKYPVAVFSTFGFSGFTTLPSIPKRLAVVATSFHVKPLLKWLQRERSFIVLNFESKHVQIYQGSLTHLRTIDKIHYEKNLGLDAFMKLVSRVTQSLFEGAKIPVVLAGSKFITGKFYHHSGSEMVLPTAITSARELGSPADLHRAAIAVLEPYMRQVEAGLVRKYWQADRNGETSNSLNELVPLALKGRIQHLFVSEKINIWGQINYATGEFSYSQAQSDSYDDCILDDLSELVIFHGGNVTVLPAERMPGIHAACGILKTKSPLHRPSTTAV